MSEGTPQYICVTSQTVRELPVTARVALFGTLESAAAAATAWNDQRPWCNPWGGPVWRTTANWRSGPQRHWLNSDIGVLDLHSIAPERRALYENARISTPPKQGQQL